MASTTPARRQYLKMKEEHPDAILLFRMGDFYETFDEDARITARELEIALTSRGDGQGAAGASGRDTISRLWTATWPDWSSAATRSPSASR